MAEIYIINSDTPKDIALELQQIDSNNTYTVLKSKTAKALLLEIEELRKVNGFYKDYSLFKKYIFDKTFEPNKLSNREIEDLCIEFYENFIASNNRRNKIYPNPPAVNIIEELLWWFPSAFQNGMYGYKQIFNNYLNKIDRELPPDDFSMPFIDPLHISKTYGAFINRNHNLGGIIHYGRENSRIYKIMFYRCNLSPQNQKFWSWYEKTFDVIAIYYDKLRNTCNVIKKPDEWRIEDNDTKMYYRYGSKEKFFSRGIEIPKWLYITPAEELDPQDYFLLQNADVKAEFVRKIGVSKLVDLGTIIDSYENYPDNEMWAKSEYKIIDMHEFIPPRRIVNQWGYVLRTAKPFTYAPFLYMKNQTTGIYHLEGIHPRCRTLYDAIKMRYNELNIKNYDIKDIK